MRVLYRGESSAIAHDVKRTNENKLVRALGAPFVPASSYAGAYSLAQSPGVCGESSLGPRARGAWRRVAERATTWVLAPPGSRIGPVRTRTELRTLRHSRPSITDHRPMLDPDTRAMRI